MAGDSDIEWTDSSWNAIRGCMKISPGCKHCYAETFAERFVGQFQTRPDMTHQPEKNEKRRQLPVLDAHGVQVKHPYHDGFEPRLVPEALDIPLRWKRGRRIFTNSMSDLFLDDVPDSYIDKMLAVMLLCPRHTFQNLTKRAERMRSYFADEGLYARVLRAAEVFRSARPMDQYVGISDPRNGLPAWTWFGVSVEDKKYGLPRIEHLRNVPAKVRFLSIEPLLEDLGPIDLTGIHWVIIGGESGNGARDCDIKWIRNIVSQCQKAAVPVFVKQFGRKPVLRDRFDVSNERFNVLDASGWNDHDGPPTLAHKKGADPSEWPEELRIREMPRVYSVLRG
jgi:protein gp37